VAHPSLCCAVSLPTMKWDTSSYRHGTTHKTTRHVNTGAENTHHSLYFKTEPVQMQNFCGCKVMIN